MYYTAYLQNPTSFLPTKSFAQVSEHILDALESSLIAHYIVETNCYQHVSEQPFLGITINPQFIEASELSPPSNRLICVQAVNFHRGQNTHWHKIEYCSTNTYVLSKFDSKLLNTRIIGFLL